MNIASEELEIIRNMWRDTIEGDGGKCPCCNRWGKIYARNINETMCRSLIWLAYARANARGWVDVPETAPRWLVRSNQLATLRWWNLVERLPSEDPDAKHSGLWRVTDLGRDFVAGKVQVPKTAYTYNGEVEYMSSGTISVSDCFGKRFSYAEVMAAQAPVGVAHGSNP